MNLEYFIAQRTHNGDSRNHPNVMVRIATLSVGVSISVMILALAVIFGFKTQFIETISSVASPVTITAPQNIDNPTLESIHHTPHLDSLLETIGGIRRISGYVARGGVIKSSAATKGIVVKGLDKNFDSLKLRSMTVEGEVAHIGAEQRNKDIMISQGVATTLGLAIGDRVEVLFIDPNSSLRRDQYRLSGTFSSGLDEFDNNLAITDIRNLQRIAMWSSDQISGVELDLPIERAQQLSDSLSYTLWVDPNFADQDIVATNLYSQNSAFFDWLSTHDVNGVVIIVIMIVVAIMNMATALLILVLERTRMIGLLKSLGMSNKSIRRIFLLRSAMITLRGVAWGNIIGVGLAAAQMWFGIIKLDSSGYLLSEVPIDLSFGWWSAINLLSISVIVVVMQLPTLIISKISPTEAIKYH